MKVVWIALAFITLGVGQFSCKSVDSESEVSNADPGKTASKAWIAKAARVLRYDGDIESGEMNVLSGMTEDQVLDVLMKDRRFPLTILDFNLYFLGAKTDKIIDGNGNLSGLAQVHPNAITSAVEASRGGDYLALLDYKQTTLVGRRLKLDPDASYFNQIPEFLRTEENTPSSSSNSNSDYSGNSNTEYDAFEETSSDDIDNSTNDSFENQYGSNSNSYGYQNVSSRIREMPEKKVFGIVRNHIAKQIETVRAQILRSNLKEACRLYEDNDLIFKRTYDLREIMGLSESLVNKLSTFDEFRSVCGEIEGTPNPPNYKNKFEKGARNFFKVYDQLIALDIRKENEPLNLKFFKPVDIEFGFLGEAAKTSFTIEGFWDKNKNSSTNFNRKRSASILRTYFCDNLTPINVATPSNHTDGSAHATDASCQACHYKLDPMAGFFKDHGITGYDFSGPVTNYGRLIKTLLKIETDNFYVFDDRSILTNQKVDQYKDTWKARRSTREWNIGYVRSSIKDRRNSYGTKFADLQKIIRTAPEVRQCIVNRMAEYFIGKDQAFDQAWINSLYKDFASESNSTQGFKKVVKKLVKSSVFRQSNPIPNHCYDYPPGIDQSERPPCDVAFLFKKNCTKCHDKEDGAGGLSLETWIKKADGQFGFYHLTEDSYLDEPETVKQMPRCETLKRIKERLSSTDRNRQMPLKKHMSSKHRETLYLWTVKSLEGCN